MAKREKLFTGVAPVPVTPTRADDVEAWTVHEFARVASLGRSLVYEALSPEKAAARGLPLLPSLKVGRSRRIRPEAGRSWLRELERRTARVPLMPEVSGSPAAGRGVAAAAPPTAPSDGQPFPPDDPPRGGCRRLPPTARARDVVQQRARRAGR